MTPRRRPTRWTLTQSLAPTPGQPDKKPMHIPVRMGLVGPKRRARLPLTLEGENRDGPGQPRAGTDARRTSASSLSMCAEEPLLSLGRGFSAPAIFRTPLSRRERAILMGKDSDAFNRWEAGQSLAAEIMLEVAGRARGDANGDYLAAIGDVLARRRGRSRLCRPDADAAHRERAGGDETPVDPGRHPHRPRRRWCAPSRAAHGERLAQLYEHMRDAERFQPDAAVGRPARLAQCLPALSDRRGRRSRGGPGRCALPHRHQHDRHDRRAGRADAHGSRRCAMPPSPISTTASAAMRWCWTNG